MEADQRLVEGIISGMGVKECNPATSPGTKSKPITKEAHKDIMSRRMAGMSEANEEIVRQKAEIDRLSKEISDLYIQLKGGADPINGHLDTTHGSRQDANQIKDDLGKIICIRLKFPMELLQRVTRAQGGRRTSPTKKPPTRNPYPEY